MSHIICFSAVIIVSFYISDQLPGLPRDERVVLLEGTLQKLLSHRKQLRNEVAAIKKKEREKAERKERGKNPSMTHCLSLIAFKTFFSFWSIDTLNLLCSEMEL